MFVHRAVLPSDRYVSGTTTVCQGRLLFCQGRLLVVRDYFRDCYCFATDDCCLPGMTSVLPGMTAVCQGRLCVCVRVDFSLPGTALSTDHCVCHMGLITFPSAYAQRPMNCSCRYRTAKETRPAWTTSNRPWPNSTVRWPVGKTLCRTWPS